MMTDHPGKAALAAIMAGLDGVRDEGAHGVNIGKLRSIAAYVAELEAFKAKATNLVGEAARKQGEAEGKLAALEGSPAFIIEQWRERAEKAEKDVISLLSIIAEIREKSGVGDGPMLTELADAIKAKIDDKP